MKKNNTDKPNINRRLREEAGMSELLQLFRQVNNLDDGLNEFDVYNTWKQVLGPGIRSYTLDMMFKRGVLYVKLSSSIVRDDLSHGKNKIIQMLNEDLKKEIIKDIKFL